MGDFFEKLVKLKTAAKIGITGVVMAGIGAGYFFLFFTDLLEQVKSAQAHQEQLKSEKAQYEKRKVEYLAYRNEMNQLQEDQRELLKQLPKKAEIPTFVGNIQEQAELAGLEVITINIEPEIPQELYIKIPVRLEVKGTYHQVTRYFKNLSELRRVVNVENLSLTPDRAGAGVELQGSIPTKMKARFMANTFRFAEPSEQAAAKKP